jgi:YD repeat-containing protein
MVWRYDAQGRLVEQRKRTGETNFTVSYADARSDRVDHITDAVGGNWVFSYANEKVSSITDPAGRVTAVVVDDQGDVTRIVEPDGETHVFTYDKHHMTTKTSPRGDVTSYTFADDGTLATVHKPSGETYATTASLSNEATHDPATGKLVHSGQFTDARGVVHTFTTNVFGEIEKETYVADGVSYTSARVYSGDLQRPGSAGSPEPYPRKNTMLRVALTARSRTSGGYLLFLPMAPSFQGLESPGNPG